MLGVAVVIDEHLCAREPAAVDQRGVVSLVGEHHVAWTSERRDDPGGGEESRAEQKRAVAAQERGEALLQAAMDGHRPRRQARGTGTHSPAHGGLRGGLANPRMIGHTQAVVRAQQEHRLAIEDDVWTLRPADQADAVVKAQRTELAEASLDLDHVGTVG